jgi:Spy/CpxP family protein refolding chaperone
MSVHTLMKRPVFWAALIALVVPVGMISYAGDRDAPLAGPPTTQRNRGDRGPRREGFRGDRAPQREGFRGGDQQRTGPGMPLRGLLRDLDLTDEQGQQIRSIVQEAQRNHRQAMEEHRKEIEQIDQLMQELIKRKQQLR